MANVLVTGGSGFIGFHLVQRLVDQQHRVTVLVRRSSQVKRLAPLGVELRYGELADPESLKQAVAGCDAVYHVAGLTRALRYRRLYEVNRDGTENLCRACAAQSTPPVLLVVSSLAAAGPALPGSLRCESDVPTPVSHYGRSKLAGELAARRFANRVPITVVRPPVVFGPWDRNALPMFRGIARTGFHLVPGWRRRPYSVIHAEDLAHLLILACQRGERLPHDRDSTLGGHDAEAPLAVTGQGVYFAASSENPTWAQLGRWIAESLGRPVRVLAVPTGFVWIVSCFVELVARITRQPRYLSFDKVREITAGTWVCSIQKCVRQLGYTPGDARRRIHQTAMWYRENGWL